MVGKKAEAGGIAKDGAKMVMAVANVKVSISVPCRAVVLLLACRVLSKTAVQFIAHNL